MRFYSYSSYENSKCGFVMCDCEISTVAGKFTNDLKISVDSEKNQIIKSFFECSQFDFAFGKIPDSSEYFILVKKIEIKDHSPHLFFNFAFLTSDKSEYYHLLSGILKMYEDKGNVVCTMSSFLEINKKETTVGFNAVHNKIMIFLKECFDIEVVIPKEYNKDDVIYMFRKMKPDHMKKNRSSEIKESLNLNLMVVQSRALDCHIAFNKYNFKELIMNWGSNLKK